MKKVTVDPELIREAGENEEAFEKLLAACRNHIRFRVYRTTHRIIEEDDDEWSVAVLAFWEAVKSFDGSKGTFLHFADTVISRRIIDQIRQNTRYSAEVPVDPDEALASVSSEDTVEDEREFEIAALSEEIRKYGISFEDLVTCSPKSRKTKRACEDAVHALMKDSRLLDILVKTRELPIKNIAEISGVSRKTIERHRKYIIAAAEILTGDYPELAEYMR